MTYMLAGRTRETYFDGRAPLHISLLELFLFVSLLNMSVRPGGDRCTYSYPF